MQNSIQELRDALLNEPQFANIFACYMAWLEKNHKIAFGSPISNESLKTAIQIGLSKFYETSVAFKHVSMQSVKNLHFIHGAGEVRGKKNIQLVFFYFIDLDMGLISSIQQGSNVEGLVRFQIVPKSTSDADSKTQMN